LIKVDSVAYRRPTTGTRYCHMAFLLLSDAPATETPGTPPLVWYALFIRLEDGGRHGVSP
jgi:hypothetical protein